MKSGLHANHTAGVGGMIGAGLTLLFLQSLVCIIHTMLVTGTYYVTMLVT